MTESLIDNFQKQMYLVYIQNCQLGNVIKEREQKVEALKTKYENSKNSIAGSYKTSQDLVKSINKEIKRINEIRETQKQKRVKMEETQNGNFVKLFTELDNRIEKRQKDYNSSVEAKENEEKDTFTENINKEINDFKEKTKENLREQHSIVLNKFAKEINKF